MYSQSTLFRENLALIQFGVRHEKDWNFAGTLFRKNRVLGQLYQKFSLYQKVLQEK